MAGNYIYVGGGPQGPAGPTVAPSYGTLSTTASAVGLTLTASDTFYKIANWDTVANASGVTPSLVTSDMTVNVAGWYKMAATMTFQTDHASKPYEFSLFINGAEHVNARQQVSAQSGTNVIVAITDLNHLAANDVLDIRVRGLSTVAGTVLTVLDANFCIFTIGGS